MKETLLCPECGHILERFKNPLPTVDVIATIDKKIVLIKRKNPPYGWALPGGFIDWGESAEEAAIREIREEIGIDLINLRQFHCYSEPERDPRFHTITVVFTAEGIGTPHAGDDAAGVKLFDKQSLPASLAFDHKRILNDYFMSDSSTIS